MDSLVTGAIVFACLFGGAIMGMLLRRLLPEHHLSSESKETVKLGMGLIGTMAALVLGLMVSSAKSSYDAQKNELTQMCARVILLDRTLARYGTETKATRELLHEMTARVLAQMWPESNSTAAELDPLASHAEQLFGILQELSPKSEAQRALQAQALSIASEVGLRRWLLFEQAGRSFAMPFLVVLIFWLTIIFISFGLMAPPNVTVLTTLLLCAAAVAGAIFIIMELDRPFDGMLKISAEPLRKALSHLGK